MNHPKSHVLVIGGLDPLGAAGILQDLKVIQSFHIHGSCLLTASTIQNSDLYEGEESISKASMQRQWDLLKKSMMPDAIKVGLVVHINQLQLLKTIFKESGAPVVFDPVLGASAGKRLWDLAMVDYFLNHLLQHVAIFTPNLVEAGYFLEHIDADYAMKDDPVFLPKENSDFETFRADCRRFKDRFKNRLQDYGLQSLYLKGGHGLNSNIAIDFFDSPADQFEMHSQFSPQKYRGSGCFLAAALASALAKKQDGIDAAVTAKSAILYGFSHSWPLSSHQILETKPWGMEASQDFDPNDIGNSGLHISYRPKIPFGEKPLPSPAWQDFKEDYRHNLLAKALTRCDIGIYPIVNNFDDLKRFVSLGVQTIQLRIKGLTDHLEADIVQSIDLARKANCQLFINDHWQLALKHQAFGVHLGQEDLEFADLDLIAAANLRLGISSHCYYEALRAAKLYPAYIAIGPVFPTTCKSMRFKPKGFKGVQEWVRNFPDIPIVAIGGIQIHHLKELKNLGVSGVSAISALLDAKDPQKECQNWLDLWGRDERI